ncbi:hypothetical protein PXH69_30460 [Rhodococcus qingshengii]|uniref:Uncharacterized protein n=1 Tax=Rhodococcus qingshengii TaxID=334542 RepID=A0AAW6LTU0_RHOSG|nr:hypothetical protein [Rhodococcus qingshengii]MDE8649303.1 hypothetical protein [Rhodococcus qingshengii]
MSSSVFEDPKVHLVEHNSSGTYELFRDAEQARKFSKSLPGSSVRELVVRDSHSPRTVTFERRVRISDGVIVLDRWDEEVSFQAVDSDVPGGVDVESYESSNGDWNVVGIGLDISEVRRAVDTAVRPHVS